MSWIVFADRDAEILSKSGISCSRSSGSDAMAAALAASPESESIVLMPSVTEQRVLALHIKTLHRKPAASESTRMGFASSGILGLDGDAVYLDELPEPQPWWKKLF